MFSWLPFFFFVVLSGCQAQKPQDSPAPAAENNPKKAAFEQKHQPVRSDGFAECGHSVEWYLRPANVDYTEPQTDKYNVPDKSQRKTFRRSIRLALEGFANRATELADELDYKLCEGNLEDGGTALVWAPTPIGSETGYARLAVRTEYKKEIKPILLSAPHPLNDTHTDKEAVTLFSDVPARATIIAGAHRCTNTTPTECGGAIDSKKCEFDSHPWNYFNADMAHTVASYFHAAHVALGSYGRWNDTVIVQLHGFASDDITSGYSKEAIVSDGTVDYASPAYLDIAEDSHAARFIKELADEFGSSTIISSCNEFPSVSTNSSIQLREFLCGQSVPQNHMINDSPAPCELEKSPSSKGRYIHFEQSWDIRDPNGDGPSKVADALSDAFE